MKNKRFSWWIAVPLAILLISGCSKDRGTDAKFARSVIDAVYAGSLSSIQDSLSAQMQAAPPQMIAAAGAALKQQFGAVKSLELKSAEPVMGFDQRIWTVTAERGTFDMRLVMDKEGKLAGLWF